MRGIVTYQQGLWPARGTGVSECTGCPKKVRVDEFVLKKSWANTHLHQQLSERGPGHNKRVVCVDYCNLV